jgi:hypothetical protein
LCGTLRSLVARTFVRICASVNDVTMRSPAARRTAPRQPQARPDFARGSPWLSILAC